jgi:hypothetical protein
LKKKKEKFGPDHPALRGSFDERVDQASFLLPKHLATRVKNIYLWARWKVHGIYKRHQEREDKRKGLK